jgi:acyl-CoA synthetase (NDP forming)
MPHPLDSLFAPDSIALIGASRDLEKIPGRLLSMLRKNEFPGKIFPINPNYGDIDGLPMSDSRSILPSSSSRPAPCSAHSSNALLPASGTR